MSRKNGLSVINIGVSRDSPARLRLPLPTAPQENSIGPSTLQRLPLPAAPGLRLALPLPPPSHLSLPHDARGTPGARRALALPALLGEGGAGPPELAEVVVAVKPKPGRAALSTCYAMLSIARRPPDARGTAPLLLRPGRPSRFLSLGAVVGLVGAICFAPWPSAGLAWIVLGAVGTVAWTSEVARSWADGREPGQD